jgi:threonine/homoserine/homoserine lactone efflux protein
MHDELAFLISGFKVVFSFSFFVALTGAMTPGPLLTYTIIKSVKTARYGYLTGLWVILGHALLEMLIVLFILLGFSFVLKNIIIVRVIGVIGGLVLVLFGFSIIRDIWKGKMSADFLEEYSTEEVRNESKRIGNPVIGGFVVSMSNPYWWVWWATIGFALMLQFDVSFKQWPRLVAFFLGHEAGDLAWYLIVSFLAYFGLRRLNKKIYFGFLVCCGLFMIFFGVYIGVSPFLDGFVKSPISVLRFIPRHCGVG